MGKLSLAILPIFSLKSCLPSKSVLTLIGAARSQLGGGGTVLVGWNTQTETGTNSPTHTKQICSSQATKSRDQHIGLVY